MSVTLILWGYTTGKAVGLSGYILGFPSEEVRRIVDAFESRYGPPSRIQQEEFVSKEGARFPNPKWQWDFPNSTITIGQHAKRLGTGMALVSLRGAVAEFRERTEQRERGAGKGP